MLQVYTSQLLTPFQVFTDGIEGPVCDRTGNIYAVNFARQGTIGVVTPTGNGTVFVELPHGSIGNGIRLSNDGGTMFVADYTNHNVLSVDMATRDISVYAHDKRLNQPNDIAIGKNGSIYASDPCWTTGSGQIWHLGQSRQFVLLEQGMGTTNGIDIGPDERTLYVNETRQRRIWAYDLALDGSVGNKRLFHQFSDFMMDGMRCDQAGNLFVTRYGKGTVAMLSPHGELLREIALHGQNCTNITFGGQDGRTCYVTMADTGAIEWFRTEIAGREP